MVVLVLTIQFRARRGTPISEPTLRVGLCIALCAIARHSRAGTKTPTGFEAVDARPGLSPWTPFWACLKTDPKSKEGSESRASPLIILLYKEKEQITRKPEAIKRHHAFSLLLAFVFSEKVCGRFSKTFPLILDSGYGGASVGGED